MNFRMIGQICTSVFFSNLTRFSTTLHNLSHHRPLLRQNLMSSHVTSPGRWGPISFVLGFLKVLKYMSSKGFWSGHIVMGFLSNNITFGAGKPSNYNKVNQPQYCTRYQVQGKYFTTRVSLTWLIHVQCFIDDHFNVRNFMSNKKKTRVYDLIDWLRV